MNKTILSAVFTVLLAAGAQAQTAGEEVPRAKKLRPGWVTTGCGGYTFSGYGGFSHGYSGFGYGYYYGPVAVDYAGYGMGSLYGGPGYYGFRGYSPRPSASVDRSGPVSDRKAESTSAREIDEGRARLKSGDYRGAVDQFRSAVAAHTENPLAQAWFAVALALIGDVKNADKALRAASAAGFPLDRVGLADAFRDEKERVRVIVALAKASGDGSLAVAFALSQMGEGALLKKLAEKDPVARQLLPKS